MDYETKYRDANNKVATRFGTNVAKEIFTDLYESEDERIRKVLIDFFEDWRKNRSHCWGIAVTDILSWLEKQGRWTEADDEESEIAINALKGAGQHSSADWLKSIKERYTWKPNEEQMIALHQAISGCSYDIEPLLELETKLKEF